MKLGDGLATWEKFGVGIAAPVWGTVASNKFREREPVAFWARVVLAEGEEEVGSDTLVELLQTYKDRLEADVIVIADSGNWARRSRMRSQAPM